LLHVQLGNETKSAKHWEGSFVELAEKYEKLENDIENKSIVELQKEKAFLMQRNSKLESDNLILIAENKSLHDALKDYNEYQMENVELKIKIEEFQNTLNKSSDAMILAGKRFEEFEKENENLTKTVEKQKYRINQLENEVDKLKDDYDNVLMNNCFDEAGYIDKINTANDTIEKLEFMIERLLQFRVKEGKNANRGCNG
jgi:chromosome segregation ATPase